MPAYVADVFLNSREFCYFWKPNFLEGSIFQCFAYFRHVFVVMLNWLSPGEGLVYFTEKLQLFHILWFKMHSRWARAGVNTEVRDVS